MERGAVFLFTAVVDYYFMDSTIDSYVERAPRGWAPVA